MTRTPPGIHNTATCTNDRCGPEEPCCHWARGECVAKDACGRYVAHVFDAPGETDKRRIVQQGTYLNQCLVDEGLAKPL